MKEKILQKHPLNFGTRLTNLLISDLSYIHIHRTPTQNLCAPSFYEFPGNFFQLFLHIQYIFLLDDASHRARHGCAFLDYSSDLPYIHIART